MEIDLGALSGKDVYSFMIQAIVPRPIAWVLSDNGTGTLNLAPFSYFNGRRQQTADPFDIDWPETDRSRKDTWRNIEERRHFVVHIASTDMAPVLSSTAASLAFGESEVEKNNIELTPVTGWPLPRVTQAKIALLCEHHQIVEIGEGPQGLVIGKINRAYLSDEIAQNNKEGLTISTSHLDPLARLGGDNYAGLEAEFTVPRPA